MRSVGRAQAHGGEGAKLATFSPQGELFRRRASGGHVPPRPSREAGARHTVRGYQSASLASHYIRTVRSTRSRGPRLSCGGLVPWTTLLPPPGFSLELRADGSMRTAAKRARDAPRLDELSERGKETDERRGMMVRAARHRTGLRALEVRPRETGVGSTAARRPRRSLDNKAYSVTAIQPSPAFAGARTQSGSRGPPRGSRPRRRARGLHSIDT